MSTTDNTSSEMPPFISAQLENYPILPGEDRQELRSVFRALAGETAQTAVEFFLVFRTSVLTYERQRLERMHLKLIRHHRLPAVGSLLERVYMPGAEHGSLAIIERKTMAVNHFKSDADRKIQMKMIIDSGYEADAVEVEAYLQAMPHLVVINRQIDSLDRQLLAMFKELDRRYARRAQAIKEQSQSIIARARSDQQAEQDAA